MEPWKKVKFNGKLRHPFFRTWIIQLEDDSIPTFDGQMSNMVSLDFVDKLPGMDPWWPKL